MHASTTPLEEALIGELRTLVGLGLDETVEVMRRCCNPALSRSAVDRCLKRQGLARRPPPEPAPKPARFQDTAPAFVRPEASWT